MKKTLNQLGSFYTQHTFNRKIDYIKYNFSQYLKKLNKSSCVLEIGPGFGEFIYFLNVHNITNIDILDNSRSVLEYNKSHFKLQNAILTSNIRQDEKKLRMYDVIMLIHVLEHIPKTQFRTFIKNLYNHLKPEGVLIITVPNGASLFGTSERYNDLQHEILFTENSLKELPIYCGISKYKIFISGFKIPPCNVVNIVRTILQKVFHLFLSMLYIVNGGVYLKIYNPSISLIIQKAK